MKEGVGVKWGEGGCNCNGIIQQVVLVSTRNKYTIIFLTDVNYSYLCIIALQEIKSWNPAYAFF
jgi:hypothetical protein